MTTNKGYFFGNKTFQKGDRLPPRRDIYGRPDSQRLEYQMFSSEYFSGADVNLYIGDVWVDEITNIAFQLQEEVMPVYGYASYTYDAIARGKRLLQGAFTINFTSAGYLQEILENAHAIFYAIENGKKDGLLPPNYYDTMNLNDILKKLGKKSFDQIADEYEKAIWGIGDDKGENLSYADRPYFRQDDLGFDIRIQYGAVAETSQYVEGKFYQKTKTEPPNVTVDVINGVQLMSMAKIGIGTDAAGAPIQEQYSFMARDLNGMSFAHLNKLSGSQRNKERETLDTTYRKLQYGLIR